MPIYNIFPLTIFKTKIELSNDEKNKMIKSIQDMKNNSKNLSYKNQKSSWTGDTQGFEELHNDKNFKKLYEEINKNYKKNKTRWLWCNSKDCSRRC